MTICVIFISAFIITFKDDLGITSIHYSDVVKKIDELDIRINDLEKAEPTTSALRFEVVEDNVTKADVTEDELDDIGIVEEEGESGYFPHYPMVGN